MHAKKLLSIVCNYNNIIIFIFYDCKYNVSSFKIAHTPTVPYGNHGCQGGNMYYAFLYVISNEGVDKMSSYPFKGKV